jgi:diguanylate cyclase (GGDEF)-like protein
VSNQELSSSPRFSAGGLSRPSRSVVATWLAASAFIVILVIGWIHTKTTVEQQLHDHVLSMAQLAADRTTLTFDAVGGALQTIGDGLQADDLGSSSGLSSERRMALQTMLIRVRARNPSLVSLSINDPSGRTIAMSPFHGDRGSAASRTKEAPPFTQDDRGLPSVSLPFRDQATGIWLVRIMHRIAGTNGMTSGAVIADVAISETLIKFFQHYPLADGDTIAIQDATGRQLAVLPASTSVGPASANDNASPPSETVQYVSAPGVDTVQLIVSRKLPHYPFYVTFGQSVDSWLLTWRQEQFVLALAALAALIVTAAITTGIQRRMTLTGQLQKVRGDLEESNTALRGTLAAAEMLAARDQLTGLCNRRNFDQRLEGTIARAARHGDVFSLLMLDIDHFKNINDYYGHSIGDEVLRRFGEVLTARLRQNDVAARWGGEEFVVLADGANLDNARMLAEQIRESVATTTFSPVPRVTVSVGIADYQEGETGDDLLRRADKALYGAKRNGRNRVIAAENGQMLKRQSA